MYRYQKKIHNNCQSHHCIGSVKRYALYLIVSQQLIRVRKLSRDGSTVKPSINSNYEIYAEGLSKPLRMVFYWIL